VRVAGSPPYDSTDADLARELGVRASLAIDNARLFQAAQAATRAREVLLGIVAPDLRSPLHTILCGLGGVEEALAPRARERRPLALATRSAERMIQLVSDLLDRHAAESGRLSISAEPCDARDLASAALDAHRWRVNNAGLRLSADLAGDLARVLADRRRVHQIFANLLDNAVKFTPRGGEIVVGARREAGHVCFFVRDSGPGIPEEMLGVIFERYWQARATDRRGVGLGLCIAKTIVEAHGGRIGAKSDPGGGSTFWFTLPAASASSAHRGGAALH
jgi:signal transduction histidine kinase